MPKTVSHVPAVKQLFQCPGAVIH